LWGAAVFAAVSALAAQRLPRAALAADRLAGLRV
jgi:hypothetical protein